MPDNNKYQPSGRLKLFLEDNQNFGFSCNFLQLQDSLDSITKGERWTKFVSSRSGAPSVDFSNLRPNGSPISRGGGSSSGVLPFMDCIDANLRSAKREHNKNHAGLIGLDITHDEFPEFLKHQFHTASKVVYVTAGNAPTKRLKLFYEYYIKQPKLFMYKRNKPYYGTNLCTEIRMNTNKSTCVLGTFNIAAYINAQDFIDNFVKDFTEALTELVDADLRVKSIHEKNKLYCELVSYARQNHQVGLSITGLATFIGRIGLTYHELVADEEHWFWKTLEKGYRVASAKQPHNYVRFFCQAPLVHSHLKFTDGVTGLHVTPGIEPLEGYQIGEQKFSRIVSQTHGNHIYEHPVTTPTIHDVDVDYSTWLAFNDAFNRKLIDQAISFSVYDVEGKSFSFENFMQWYNSSLPSLYYYVPTAYVDTSVINAKFNEIEIPACDLTKWELLDNDCGCAS